METIKFILFWVVVVAFVGLVGFWAVTSIQSGSEHASGAKLSALQKENDDLKKQVENLSTELDTYKTKAPDPVVDTPPVAPAPVVKTPTPTTTTKPTVYKNQSLIDELSQLVKDKVTMKLHSVGTRVGTVQKFLNLYNKTNNKIDNDYGASTVKAVTAFQKAQGLTADGSSNTSTFNKMIDWLKKQG